MKPVSRAGIGKFFSVQIQIANILGFEGHVASVTTTPVCHWSKKTAIDNKKTNECAVF